MMWEPSGYWAGKGVLDFAGGTVVHINAGIAGLVCALVLGKRLGYGKEPMAPHNLTLTLIGASLLWVGWFGFNAGSAVAADGRAGMAMVVTQLATAVAALAGMFTEWITKGKPSVLGIASGAVAGLVAITPASGFVRSPGHSSSGSRRACCAFSPRRPSNGCSATTTRSTHSACTASAVSSGRS
jgi:Amt family ammonium transporter